jgi:hypothetical protein
MKTKLIALPIFSLVLIYFYLNDFFLTVNIGDTYYLINYFFVIVAIVFLSLMGFVLRKAIKK